MDLIFGKIYLIHTKYHEIFNKEYYDDLTPMVYTHNIVIFGEGLRYYFEEPIEGFVDSLSWSSLSDCVFENEHQFLKHTLSESSRIHRSTDSFIQNKINKSQEIHPEEWI